MGFMTVSQAAAHIGITRVAIYQAIRAGTLKSETRYDKIVISEREVERYAAIAGERNGYYKRAAVITSKPTRKASGGASDEQTAE